MDLINPTPADLTLSQQITAAVANMVGGTILTSSPTPKQVTALLHKQGTLARFKDVRRVMYAMALATRPQQ